MRLVIQAGRKFNLIDPKEVEAQLAGVKAQFQTAEEFQVALNKNNVTIAQLTEQFEARIALEKLQVKDIAVTDDEIKAYFDANQADLGQPEQVRARHILVKTEDEAKSVVEKLKGGADFAKLAEELSIDPSAKEAGGDLGFFGRGEMVKEFEDAAFSLKPGETSSPIQTQFGYHIIRVEERKEAIPANFDEKKPEIKEFLVQQKAKSPEQVIQDLKSQAEIKVLWP
jgi:foldase protein PrsA